MYNHITCTLNNWRIIALSCFKTTQPTHYPNRRYIMPSEKNKKKRGRAKKIAGKLAARAQAQDAAAGEPGNANSAPLSSAVYPHPSPFAVPETPSKTLQRVLGYKFVCDLKDDMILTITPLDRGDGKFRLTYLGGSGDSFDVTTAFLQEQMYNLVPDYDRDPASFPISRKLIERELPSLLKDLTRKVMKLYDSVPEAERDVFMKFVDRGEGITVSVSSVKAKGCFALVPTIGMYTFKVDLVGAGNGGNSFAMTTKNGGRSFTFEFVGDLETHCLQRYHKELAMLLMQECITRLSLGTAESSEDVSLDSTTYMLNAITNALESMYVDMKRWTELMSLRASRFEWRVKSKAALQRVGEAAGSLGEALEACGHNSKAALIYAECGKYFYDAKHPKTATLLGNAGLAWKRHGDWEKAESFYAASIESTRFIHDPLEYHGSLFTYLNNLWLLWNKEENDHVLMNLVGTLRELIMGAGEPSPAGAYDQQWGFRDDCGFHELRNDLCTMSEENFRRVLKSIAERSVSVEAMRGAIKSCSNPNTKVIAITSSKLSKKELKACRSFSREGKDAAREYIKNGKFSESIFIATCAACGEMKNAENALMKCSACKKVYYCDAKCQKAHWKKHSDDCKAWRK